MNTYPRLPRKNTLKPSNVYSLPIPVKYLSALVILASIILSVFSVSCNNENNNETPSPNNPLYRVSGNKILNASNQVIKLQGVAFGNEVWADTELPYTHHS